MNKLILVFSMIFALNITSAMADTSMVFGKADAKVLSVADTKGVVGKGYAADYYGYYGHAYAQQAVYAASQAYQYKNADLYLSAYNYSNSASSFLYNAYLAQRNGQ